MIGSQKYGWSYWRILLWGALLVGRVVVLGQTLPDIPDLIRVSVDHANNGVWIEWEASEDTTVDLYKLYWMDGLTGSPKFTFSSKTFKFKQDTPIDTAYSVTAIDTLDGTAERESPFEHNVHRVVSLALEFDPCVPANTLKWTGYRGWDGKISGYRIYGGIAGGELQMLKFVHANTRSFTHKGVLTDTVYNYYIETVHTSGMTSLSRIVSIATPSPEPPGMLTVDHVSVLDKNTIEMQFTADVSGPVNNFRIMRRTGGSPYTEIETLWNSSQATRVFQDFTPTVDQSYQYKVQAIYQPESCTNPIVVSESNPGTSILLGNSIEDQIVTLYWTNYESYPYGLSGYIIQRRSGMGEFIDVQSVGPETTRWSETIQSVIDGFQPGELQYKVLAVGNQSPGMDSGISISNIVGVAVETHLSLPSAFTPGSNDMNALFKPVLDFSPREYVLIVYDRGGRKLFETTDPGEGWNGTYSGGNYAMEGVYVFHIEYTDYAGLFRSSTGNITVIYP
jgi:gliding motility-associated-like protein